MADLDPALVEKATRAACDSLGEPPCSYPKCSCGAKNPASLAARAALLSLGIPAAALNALYRGEAVVVNETTGLPYIESDALKAREAGNG